jgi:hypothetical protein
LFQVQQCFLVGKVVAQGGFSISDIRVKAKIEKIFSICLKLLFNIELYCFLLPARKKMIPTNLGNQFATLGVIVLAFINIMTSMF